MYLVQLWCHEDFVPHPKFVGRHRFSHPYEFEFRLNRSKNSEYNTQMGNYET